jgi:hypothetical protein
MTEIVITLPPVAEESVDAVTRSLIEAVRQASIADYDPSILARALFSTAALLAIKMAGQEWTLREIELLSQAVRDRAPGVPAFHLAPGGNA